MSIFAARLTSKMEKIFNNTEVAFALKSDTELKKAYFLFKLISKQSLVKIVFLVKI